MKHSMSMKRINVKKYISNTYIPIGSYMVIRKALIQAGIVTIEDLCRKTEEELSSIPFIKGKNLQAIKDMLAEKGLHTGISQEEINVYDTIYWSNL